MSNHCDTIHFVADAMLGNIAKWLRILGRDTLFHPHKSTRENIETAKNENRCLLTRNRRVKEWWRDGHYILLSHQHLNECILEIHRKTPILTQVSLFSRCLLCNTPVEPASKEQAVSYVPAHIGEIHEKFLYCPICSKYYWQGSHTRRVEEKVREWEKRV
ncbi:Mut7-C RNAse domain-containing protein [candidate division KSB1 bacterium]